MPYDSIEQLPDNIRSVLPAEAQKIFMEVFNSAYSGSCNQNDLCATKIAWTQVKKFYTPDQTGIYSPIPMTQKPERHDTIFNSLERQIDGKWFATAPFAETVSEWNGIPLIFAKNHPDMLNFLEDPEAELRRIDGKLVGYQDKMRIDAAGHSKLRGDMVFDEGATLHSNSGQAIKADPAAVETVKKLYQDGKLSLSTGFFCPDDKGQLNGTVTLSGKVTPNHTLVFEENFATGDTPKDPGAFILNKQGSDLNAMKVLSTTEEGEIISILQKLQGLLTGPISAYFTQKKEHAETEQESDTMDGKEFQDAIAAANKATADAKVELSAAQAKITELEAEIGKKEETLSNLQKTVDAINQQKEDASWAEAKKLLAPGLTHKSEDEAKLKDLWKNDKDAFYLKAISNLNKKGEEDDPEGNEHTQKNGDDAKDKEALKIAEASWYGMG